MAKNTQREMARGWIDGDNLMVQYATYSGPWEEPMVLRVATDRDREIYNTRLPWAELRLDGGTVIPERDPYFKG